VNKEIANPKSRSYSRFGESIGRIFLEKKLNNWVGVLLFTGIGVSMGWLLATRPLLGIGVFALSMSLALVITCLMSTETGFYLNLIYTFFAYHFSRLLFKDPLPVGVMTDVFTLLMLFSLFIKRVSLKKSINEFTHTTIIVLTLLNFFYGCLELFNPSGHSFDAWLQAIRRSLETFIYLFIAFQFLSNKPTIRKYIKTLFILCTVVAIYGCIQQWHGLFGFEMAWVMSDDLRFGLDFINGEFRKFSTFNDPTAFGNTMAACSVFFTIIALNSANKKIKRVLLGGVVFMLLGMAFSGTRTANVMLLAGLVMYILLSFNKKSTRAFAFVASLVLLVLLYVPVYNNNTLNRFRSSFTGTNDESFRVRELSRNYIRPYLHSHPFGGGLGTTGALGTVLNPGHFLAGFQTDSAYLQSALEIGWIGLFLICILFFFILRRGIAAYFNSQDPEMKTVYAGATCSIFCYYVGMFAQNTLGQITDMAFYFPLIAMILRFKHADTPGHD
jgi:putative inorganic carbon (HCO3(-)) transporter